MISISIPETVEQIGNDAFYGCKNLKTVTMPGKLTRIGVRAFSECKALTEITIPKSVIYIGEEAFHDCGSQLIIHGVDASYGQSYAADNQLSFQAVSE